MADRSVIADGALSLGVSVDLAERPTRIGPYRIIDILGRGGMGVVYLAEQLEPVQREVAIKVLRTDGDSDQVVARFETERQALAVMDHPNITKVFDAGITENGWPYFAMERVFGAPLTAYADEHRLSLRDRLSLFGQVCRAVQHAHQKGIIHRDLKPSNILVTTVDGAPVCKVIDFGIAKATQGDGARLTMTGMSLGTPTYMSPEQVLGSVDVDTRSDIYALGVVLYELIAGFLPYDSSQSLFGIMAQHTSADAITPSTRINSFPPDKQAEFARLRGMDTQTLRRALMGDVDWITLKALEKDRERRYQTATELAADIERHLADKPVTASPPSRAYLARKFVRRHRLSVAFAVTTFLLVVVGAAAIAVQSRNVSRARAIAVQRQGQAEDLIGFMLGDLRPRLKATGNLEMLAKVGKAAQDYFAGVPGGELSDQELFRRSQALRQLGDVRVDQGDFPGAMQLFRQSLSLITALAARDSTNNEWQLGLGASHFGVGFIHYRRSDLDSALAEFTAYLAITRRLVARAPDSLRFHNELGQANSNIGSVKEAKADFAGALAAYLDAITAKRFAVQHDSAKLDWQMDLANSYNAAGFVQRRLGNYAGADSSYRAELALKERLAAKDPPNQVYKQRLASAYSFVSELDMIRGKMDDAARESGMTLTLYAALAVADTSNPENRRFLATVDRLAASIALERGRAGEALAATASSRALLDPQIAKTPNNPVWQLALARTLTMSSYALTAMGRARDAEADARRAIAILEPALAKKPGDQTARQVLTDLYVALGDAAQRAGSVGAAREAWTHAVAIVDSAARATGAAELRVLNSIALASLGRVDEARPIASKLEAEGYRRPRWIARMRAAGVLSQP